MVYFKEFIITISIFFVQIGTSQNRMNSVAVEADTGMQSLKKSGNTSCKMTYCERYTKIQLIYVCSLRDVLEVTT